MGSDYVNGGKGDDLLIYTTAGNAGATDVYDGSQGNDEIRIVLTSAQYDNALFQQELAAYEAFVTEFGHGGSSDGPSYTFTSLGLTLSNIETISIVIDDTINNGPIATDDLSGIAEDEAPDTISGDVLANDTDPDALDTLTVAAVGGAATNVGASLAGLYGTLVLAADGSWTYSLDNGSPAVQALADGESVDETFTYEVTDGIDVDTADLVIEIYGTNDDPTLTAGTLAAAEDGPAVTLDLATLGDDVDSDDDGTTLSYAILGAVAEGSASISGTELTFTPGADFQDLALGETRDVAISIEATDAHGATAISVVTVTVTGTNDGPAAMADVNGADGVIEAGYLITGDDTASGNVLGNDSDPDTSDTLTVAGVAAGNLTGSATAISTGVGMSILGVYGSLVVQADGSWTYLLDDADPDTEALASGDLVEDVFTYTADDGNGGWDLATLTVSISGSDDNAPPIANNDSLVVDEDVSTLLDVLANDSDPNGQSIGIATVNGLAIAAGDSVATLHGTLTLNGDGTFTYLSDAHYSGADSFTYTATDGLEMSGTATVTLDVVPVADAPLLSLSPAGGGLGGDLSPVPSGMDVQVNTTTLNTQRYASLAALSDGGWVVTWSSYAQDDGNSWGVYSQRYDASGGLVGSEVQVNTTTYSSQLFGEITALSDGGWVATWSSYDQDGSGYGIYSQRFDATGAIVGAEARVNSYTTGDQSYSDTSALADGGWVVSWSSIYQDGSGWGIYSQRYNANGAAIGGEVLVNSTTSSDQLYSDVAALEDGGWVVTWSSYNQDGSSWGVYSQRYNAFGCSHRR
ncbi:MAG: hypothetical protein CML68_05490 [Rhodobacteraceae bacterium]|nr:hypothetical protein [Paracoccaceae bacterium]